ncbi:MAG: ABC transporter ATP-binding protein [Ruminococcaceae bacterium]|nr:ABC transporter ATP-binding protein [Oscillospiraceae bacterium]
MIEIKNLTHNLGGRRILDNIDLTLPEGSITGLVGINGAGKTTLLRLISGVYTADSGEILCDGVPISEESAREKLFFLPDDPYYTMYTTGDSLFELYRVFYPKMDRTVFLDYMKSFGLKEKRPIRNFSKGMRRQLYIALALSAKPQYLLLDEAFDGLDPLARLAFKKAINTAAEEFGTSVLISSHSLRELEDFCDSYVLIDKMRVASSGDIAERVNRLCKFQLAFVEEFSEDIFVGLPVVSIEKTGRFARIVLEGDENEMRERLDRLNPTIIEQMPMDFEEMFIHEVERKGYKL